MSGATNAVGEGAGLAGMGYGLSMNPQLSLTNPMQELAPDQSAINQQMQTQQGITNQGLQNQQTLNNNYMSQLQGLGNQDYTTLTSQLGPTGQLGQQLAGEYNNLGITPQSGAFQEGLGNQYGNMMLQQNQQQANALGSGYNNLSGISQQGNQTQSGLGQTGLQNTLGLESQGVNTQNAQALAQFMQQAGLQSALVGGGLNTAGQSAGKGGVV